MDPVAAKQAVNIFLRNLRESEAEKKALAKRVSELETALNQQESRKRQPETEAVYCDFIKQTVGASEDSKPMLFTSNIPEQYMSQITEIVTKVRLAVHTFSRRNQLQNPLS